MWKLPGGPPQPLTFEIMLKMQNAIRSPYVRYFFNPLVGAVAVAEGVEKPEELRALFEMGCDIGQGYLLAKPMPLEYFLDMINKRKATPATAVEKLNKIA